MTRIVCHLPFPVSLNSIWRHKASHSYRSTPYQNWQRLAGGEWLTQKNNQPRAISGPFRAILIVARRERSGRIDIDNLMKGVLDFAVSHCIIEDDYLCQAIYARWGTKAEAPKGCKLILRSALITRVSEKRTANNNS